VLTNEIKENDKSKCFDVILVSVEKLKHTYEMRFKESSENGEERGPIWRSQVEHTPSFDPHGKGLSNHCFPH